MTTGHGSNGTTLKVDMAGVDTIIGQIASMTPPKSVVQSEKMKGLSDKHPTPCATGSLEYDDASFQLYLDPLDDVHENLLSSTHDYDHADFGKTRTWTMEFPQVATLNPWIFAGLPKSFAVLTEVDKLLRADTVVEVSHSIQLPTQAA